MRVMLLHGWGGSDFPHWQSWLAAKTAQAYGCVNFPRLPRFDTPDKNEWIAFAAAEIAAFAPDIVICHSLGNTLWFHLCNEAKIKRKIKKLYMIAPPWIACEIEALKTFFPVTPPDDLMAKEALMIVSDNDPYLRFDQAQRLQSLLQVETKYVKNGAHFNIESGFGEWPWLYETLQKDIRRLCKHP